MIASFIRGASYSRLELPLGNIARTVKQSLVSRNILNPSDLRKPNIVSQPSSTVKLVSSNTTVKSISLDSII